MSSLKSEVSAKRRESKATRKKKTTEVVDKSKVKVKGGKDTNKNKSSLKKKKEETYLKDNFFARVKKYLTKVNITYFILAIVDIILVIYTARGNIVNYVVILDEEIFMSKTSYLLFGRNYVNLVIISFFYVYTLLVTKFYLKKEITKKFLGILFLIIFIINILLFYIFTKKVY